MVVRRGVVPKGIVREFFRPIYEHGGQIFALAAPGAAIRDGLPIAQIARFFPFFECPDVELRASSPLVNLHRNLLLVGWRDLYLGEDRKHVSGKRPAGIGGDKIGDRLRRIEEKSCFVFTEVDGERAIENKITGEQFVPRRGSDGQIVVDFGVARRIYSGMENTIVVEGPHSLGTMAIVKKLTELDTLQQIWEPVKQFPAVADTAPLEVLVEGRFQGASSAGVYEFHSVHATLLAVVLDRHWVLDLGTGQWENQVPWDLERAIPVPGGGANPGHHGPLPRLEIMGDLRGFNDETRRLCAELLAPGQRTGPASTGEADALTEALTRHVAPYVVTLVSDLRPGEHRKKLVPGGPRQERQLRFLLNLALRRLLGRPFRPDPPSIRRAFPELEGTDQAIRHELVSNTAGKTREGFPELFGKQVYARPRSRYGAYVLEGAATVVLKLRL